MFGFPKVNKPQDFQFKRNFLKSVVFQVKYANTERILPEVENIKKVLIEDYPNIKKIQTVGVNFAIQSPETPIVQQQARKDQGLQFSTKTNNKILSITEDSLTLNIVGKTYQNFNSLLSEIEKCKTVLGICGIETFNRVAIRKSNFIEFTPNNSERPLDILPQMLNNALVANSEQCPAYEFQKDGVSKMLFQNEDDTLNLQYGIIKVSENPMVNALFLDIDLFKSKESIDISELNNILTEINSEMFNVFSWAITDELVNVLNSQ